MPNGNKLTRKLTWILGAETQAEEMIKAFHTGKHRCTIVARLKFTRKERRIKFIFIAHCCNKYSRGGLLLVVVERERCKEEVLSTEKFERDEELQCDYLSYTKTVPD